MALGFEDISSWSTTAINNEDADSAINWLEHQPRASVNNSSRSEMAAHAKNRDMLNGSIVTAGTANAQTATTPVGFGGTVPTNLRMCVKVGVGLTNTASGLTLSVDGSTPAGVRNMRGQSPDAGEWFAGALVELVFDGTYWNMLSSLPGVFTPANVNNGRFSRTSATACLLAPFNGNQIRINGQIYAIPSAGINFANTGVNVGGTAGANLGANTVYLVGLYDAGGGTLTPYYSSTLADHTIDTAVGNVGTHIVGTSARTLIGMIRTNASSQFVDTAAQRFVRSWFNRQRVPVQAAPQTVSGFSSSGTILDYGGGCEFVCFSDDAISLTIAGFNDAVSGDQFYASVYVDGGAFGGSSYSYAFGSGLWAAFAPAGSGYLAEGYHRAGLGAGTPGTITHSIFWTTCGSVG